MGRPAAGGKRIPILAWIGVPAGETTPERYREFAQGGFTLNYSGMPDPDTVQRALDVSRKAGVKQ